MIRWLLLILQTNLNRIKIGYGIGGKIFYIWKNYRPLPKYVGFNHYSRYFNFLDNIPDIDKIFESYDLIVRESDRKSFTIMTNFRNWAYEPVLLETIDIIDKMFPDYHNVTVQEYYQNIFLLN